MQKEKVFIDEYGDGVRPAVVVERFEKTVTGRTGPYVQAFIRVEFTDERGGFRNCFASSVHASKADAESASNESPKLAPVGQQSASEGGASQPVGSVPLAGRPICDPVPA